MNVQRAAGLRLARGRVRSLRALKVALVATVITNAGRLLASDGDSPSGQDGEAHHLTWHAEADEPMTGRLGAKHSASRVHAEERPFGYVLDPTTPSAHDTTIEYRLGLASGVNAERPLPASVTAAGAEHSLTVGYGVTDRIAPFASVRLLTPLDGSSSTDFTGSAGARLRLTRPDTLFRLTVSAAGFREFQGALGAAAIVAGSYDLGALRVAGNVQAEKVAGRGRDVLDVLVLAGASYRVLDALRIGAEYVGQDLEEAVDPERGAEGGARNFAGPTVALDLLDENLKLVASAAAGLDHRSPPVMGRVTVLTTF